MPYIGPLNWEYIQRLIDARTNESSELDYKRQLPFDLPGERKGTQSRDSKDPLDEFVEDVSALANASGGIIIFGLEENKTTKKPQPLPIKGVKFDTARNTLNQALSDRIEPRIIGIEIEEIPFEDGYLMAVRVPQTLEGPHWCGRDVGKRRFKVRIDDSVRNMTYREIRSSFDRNSSAMSRAIDWISERTDLAYDGSSVMGLFGGAKLLVHAIPMVSYFQAAPPIDVHQIQRMLMEIPVPWVPPNASSFLNFDGCTVYAPDAKRSLRDMQPGYVHFFRNGSVEIAAHLESTEFPKRVVPFKVAEGVHRSIHSMPRVLEKLGKPGPILFGASLLHLVGSVLGMGSDANATCSRQTMIAEPVYVEDPSDSVRLLEIAHEFLDIFWQGYHFDGCPFFDERGRYKRPA
jgi:hypothetical protein